MKTSCAVSGYVDGKLQFTFADRDGVAVLEEKGPLRFFRDDGEEHSAGAVARIRLFDGPLVVAGAGQPAVQQFRT